LEPGDEAGRHPPLQGVGEILHGRLDTAAHVLDDGADDATRRGSELRVIRPAMTRLPPAP
jgi:hypothetical protein